MWNSLAWFGLAVASLMAGAVVVVMLAGALYLLCRYWPRMHVGKTKNPCEFRCYDAREILTSTNGNGLAPSGRGRLLHNLELAWWFGLSSRDGARWFFGLMRWQENK